MKGSATLGIVALMILFALGLQREEERGTFLLFTRPFLSWLVANSPGPAPTPPLTLVLYDDDSASLAGGARMGVQEATLFVRGAARLGAAAAGIEGLSEDPRRVLDASQGIFVFGGYDQARPPEAGWAVLRGEPLSTWPEVPGLPGRPGIFARGFIGSADPASGVRRTQLVGRSGGRTVPSFLAIAWGAAHGGRARELSADAHGVRKNQDTVLLAGADGAVCFLPEPAESVITMNDFLVSVEKHDRLGSVSPLQGHVLVLASATPDVPRFARDGRAAITPGEMWAEAWGPMRSGKLFLLPPWWFSLVMMICASALAIGPAYRSSVGAVSVLFFTSMLFLLISLGLFAGARILLAPVPVLLLFASAVAAGRCATLAGWRNRR